MNTPETRSNMESIKTNLIVGLIALGIGTFYFGPKVSPVAVQAPAAQPAAAVQGAAQPAGK